MNRATKIVRILVCFLATIWGFHSRSTALVGQQKNATSLASESVFETDIMPLLSKFGCNAAECHGAATGQQDFKLSLFGGDPDRDYQAIVEQLEGRRVNLISPSKSLIITKPTGVLAHGGEELFDADSEAANRFRKWIENGAERGAGSSVTGIKLSVSKIIADQRNEFSLKVFAREKGKLRDVTADSKFSSTNPTALVVDNSGRIRLTQPGKFFVIVKYLQFAKAVPVVKPFLGTKDRFETKLQNPIDQAVVQSLDELNLKLPEPISDSVFVRRLFLDLTGRLPSKQQVQVYVRDKSADKKKLLVDSLLRSPAFVDHWAFWIRKTIQFRVPGNDVEAAEDLNSWIKDSIQKEMGWSKFADQVLRTVGDTKDFPQANFHRFFTDARAESEVVANAFLGIRIGCANCHNHPLDKWTQEDYHGLAAIFATLKRGKTVSEIPDGNVIQPKTAKPAIPRIPGVYDLESTKGARQRFSKWLMESDQFKAAIVNRVWKHFMGKGIVEPVDDFRASNPPIDARLLNVATKAFEASGFRFKPLIKTIVMSDLYATNAMNEKERSFWAGYVPKSMAPEILYDAYNGLLLGEEKSIAANSLEPKKLDDSLGLLKGCNARECEPTQRESEFGLREKLHLVNGEFLNRWIHNPKNSFRAKLKNEQPFEILSDFYWQAISRPMSDSESRFWKSVCKKEATEIEKVQFLEDAIWSLLNSSEFNTIR